MSFCARSLTVIVNHLLTRDAQARQCLSPYAQRTVCLMTWQQDMIFTIQADGLLSPSAADSPDLSITLPAAAWSAYIQGGRRAMMKQVKISGDAEFAATLAKLAETLRWEPEEDLAQLIGDGAAHQIARAARGAHRQTRHRARSLLEMAVEYLTEESQQLLHHAAADAFSNEVILLRDDTDRLEKRIMRLETAMHHDTHTG
jgi:ubiquinone biosynthesis accessory factor UbiJ